MKKLIYVCLILTGIVLMGACRSQKAVVASFSDLDGEWKITELNGQAKNPAESRQMIVFDALRKHVSGNAGCNRMTGSVEYDESRKNIIKFSRMVTTRMACPDMAAEGEFLAALNKVVRFEAVGDATPVMEVAFYAADNDKVLVIKKQK